LISFQIDLISYQYHVGKASKLSRYFVAIYTRSYSVVMSLLAILGTLAQVGGHPKEMENPPRKTLDVLLLGHHLRRLERTSKPSRRPSPIRVRVCFGILDQSAIKRTPRMHPNSIFDDRHMDGNIIL
jgi:hypothetical protein